MPRLPLLDVGDVLSDPDFNEPFIVHRSQGAGNWDSDGNYAVDTSKAQTITMCGAVIQPDIKNLEQTPQADKLTGQTVFYSREPLYLTNSDGLSDVIEWKGSKYRLFNVRDWSSYGYYKATGYAIEGV